MGKAKQLLPFQNTSFLGHAITNALASKAEGVFCVLGAYADVIKKNVDKNGVIFIDNPHWNQGISASIISGINYIHSLESIPDAVLIMLTDQPLVDSDYLNLLIDTYRANANSIVTSDYGNKNGVPAIFPKKHFGSLLKLKGDKGAQAILNDSNLNIVSIVPKREHALKDIDSPEDYEAFINRKT